MLGTVCSCCTLLLFGPQVARWNSKDRDGMLDYTQVYSEREDIRKMKPLFDALQLDERTVGKLYKMFNRVDNDKSGTIEIAELLMYLDVERTPFACRAFSVFDEDGSGTVDFREFLVSLWNYCTLGKATLLIFAFDIYDTDNSGVIEAGEITHMLRDIYGEQFERNANAKSILRKVDSLGDTEINIDQFKEFTRQHQALLFPAFTMQFKLQKEILGKTFWTGMGKKRIELSKGRYVSIEEFMNLHVDAAKMEWELSNPKQIRTKSKSPHNRRPNDVHSHERYEYLTEQAAVVFENSGSYSRRKSISNRSPRAGEISRVKPTASVDNGAFTTSRGPKFNKMSRQSALVRIESGLLLDMAEFQVDAVSQKVTKKELLDNNDTKLQLGIRNKGRRQTYTQLPSYIQPDSVDTTPVSSRPSSTKSNQTAKSENANDFTVKDSNSRITTSNINSAYLSKIAGTISVDVQSKNKILAMYGSGVGGGCSSSSSSSSSNRSSKNRRRRTLG